MDAHRQIPNMADNTVALHSEAVTVSGTSTFFICTEAESIIT